MRASRAAVFLGAGKRLEVREFPRPDLEPGEAWVRVECCTVCGSDVHTATGARREPTPTILGHEAIGVVDEVGPEPPTDLAGEPLEPGDRVTWSVAVSCGNCDRCRGGLPQKCRTLAKYGHAVADGRYALSGGMAEYVLLRRGSSAVRLPADMPAEVACPANCATATVAAAFRAAGKVEGRSVLILGAGMLGLTASAFARSRGAATTTITDLDPRRLALASSFGADRAVAWTPEPEDLHRRLATSAGPPRFDVVLELSGSVDAVEAAVRLGDVGGDVVLVGSVATSRPARIDPEGLVRRCLTLKGVHNYGPDDLRTAVDFLAGDGRAFPFAGLVEASFPLSEADAAVRAMVRDRAVRVAIRP